MLFMKRAFVIFLAVCAAGCVSAARSDRAFSHEWADKVQREKGFEARKARVRNEDGTLVKVDEKGKPQLKLIDSKRLDADVDVKGGKPAGELKYEFKW